MNTSPRRTQLEIDHQYQTETLYASHGRKRLFVINIPFLGTTLFRIEIELLGVNHVEETDNPDKAIRLYNQLPD